MFDCLPAAASDIRQDKETTRDLQADSFWWKPRRLQHWELGIVNGGKKRWAKFFPFFLSSIIFLAKFKQYLFFN